VSIVTLSRPGRRNGVTIEMCEELYSALRPVAESDARVVVLRGAGDDFSVGADLTGGGSPTLPTLERLGPVYHASTLLHTMPQVTIAAIDGGCAGAAMGWACACDFRFASERARFATGFLKVGVSGDMGLVWSLERLVGAARARELLFFPEKVTASEALAYGLVTRLFPVGSLHEEVLELADELAGHHPFPLRMMKANVLSAERMDLEEYIEVESARHLHVTASPSLRAGVEAFARAKGSS
jgi:2-(1,2-epoxy-1,2-dihydrophenyl)acetyl-CoA isomerase